MSTNVHKLNMNDHNIYDRIDKFVLECLLYIRKLPNSIEYQVISKQLIRSCTSIGANAQEADGSQSKPDFIHCFTISKKEAKESLYWVKILSKYDNHLVESSKALIQECSEIIAIISKIIINTKNKST